jgi:alkanesulfonate monooxygenase SsuD/methylene tetrahydromethanopterin reductase-like flavin-dependent oxidoreductase (luciferase family)
MRFGISLWCQGTDWPELRSAATLVDRLGYDHLWVTDHLLPIYGRDDMPVYEAWTTLAALAGTTHHVTLGPLVSPVTFRNPGLLTRMAITLDHASGGRVILGLGAGWFEREHESFGLEFGASPRERVTWLSEALPVIRDLLDGRVVDHAGPRFRFDDLACVPRPIQARLPILVGGMGSRSTLRAIARHADMWNAYAEPLDVLRHTSAELDTLCREAGRDPATLVRSVSAKVIIRDDPAEASRVWTDQLARQGWGPYAYRPWVGPPSDIAERLAQHAALGFETVIVDLLAPFDVETIERLAGEVAPLVGTTSLTRASV